MQGDALALWHLRLALGDAGLDRRSALDRIDHARELDQRAVANQLDDATVVGGDRGLDEVPAERLQASVGTRLVNRHESAVADHVGGQDRRQLALDILGLRGIPRPDVRHRGLSLRASNPQDRSINTMTAKPG